MCVFYILYRQVSNFEAGTWEDLTIAEPFAFMLAMLLVFPNIWFAYRKWVVILAYANIESSLITRIQSFFAGIVTGLLTPNMIGNFIGRQYYFNEEHRPVIIGLTIIGNFAQFIVSLVFGLISVSILSELLIVPGYDIGLIGILVTIISLATYFFIEVFVGALGKSTAEKLKLGLRKNRIVRVRLLLLSAARFTVFTIQFGLFLFAFGVKLDWTLILAIWQVYMVTLLVPSLFLGKLGIKETISLVILGAIGANDYAILFASLIVWFVNTLFPAMLGLLVCKRKGATS